MISGAIPRRYAKALLKLTSNQDGRKNLETLAAVTELYQNDEANKILTSPVMPNDLKLELLKYALGKGSDASGSSLLAFIQTVIESGRVGILPEIIHEYGALLDSKEGITNATLTTAIKLPDAELKAVAAALQTSMGGNAGKINLSQQTDPGILGGMVIKIGNSLIDLSLKTKLDSIARKAML